MNQPIASGAPSRRRVAQALAGASLGCVAVGSRALMAGVAPDSAAARVDANTSSSRWSGVVSVVVDGSPYSGVAIAPRHVLTASHVVSGRTPAQVQIVLNHTTPAQYASAAAITAYPGATFPYDDLALVVLQQPLPNGVATYAVLDAPEPTGTLITLVGYGASGNGDVGPTVSASATVKRSGVNVIDQLTDHFDASGRTSPFFVYDFDAPTGNGPLGGPTVGNALETVVAGGDSGSGSFVILGNEPMLYGLNTIALGLNGATLSTFGSGGAGLVLGYRPYVDWMLAQTGEALVLSSKRQPDSIPAMPIWALAAMGGGLWWSLRKRVVGLSSRGEPG